MQMNTNIRIDEDQHSPIGRVRDALGAIAPASPAAFWLDCDADDHWRLRLEGTLQQQQFASHEATASFMRVEAACRSFLSPVHCRRRRCTRRRSTGWLFAANAASGQLTRAGQVCAGHGACPA
jgi:hypothetical protein